MSKDTHHHNIDFKKDFTVTTEPKSQVKISGEIPFAELEAHRANAIKALGANVSIDGFRKGHVPAAVLEKKLGEMAILTEMAERAISHMYGHILEAHKIDAIGYPKFEITKIAPENPLGFTATVAVVPPVELPDYKKIAKTANADKPSEEVTEEELETKIKDILRQKAAYDKLQQKASAKEGAGDTTDLPTPETVEKDEPEASPELTDEVVKTLGQPGQFENVEQFKKMLREHLEIEKKRDVTANHRATITDKIIDGSKIELPEILIESELSQMFAQMEEDLKRSNLKMDDYLSHIKKTKEDLRKDWSPAAEKRAKLQLILNEIAKKEKITADAKLVDEQTKQLLTQYKDADEMRVRTYVSSILQNEAVMKSLEELK